MSEVLDFSESEIQQMLDNLDKVKKWDWNDKVYSCLNEAIITSKDSIASKTLKKLKPVLKRRFSL